MNILYRNNISIIGSGRKALIFAHSFGSDQNIWRFITPSFEDEYKIILFDHVGAGKSDTSAYSDDKYDTLQGYADDVLEICKKLSLENVTYVGHGAGGIIGALTAIKKPNLFEKLIMLSSSAYHIKDKEYNGGYTAKEMQSMLNEMDSDYISWSNKFIETLVDSDDKPALTEEIKEYFAHTDPEIARHFIRTALLSDHRKNLKMIKTETLVIQGREDKLAPLEAGDYIQCNISSSEMVILNAKGHYPSISAPNEIVSAMRLFL